MGLVVFALTPLLSLGFGSWLAFVVAAIRYSHLGRRVALLLWGSALVQLAAVVGMAANADSSRGTSADRVFGVCLFVAVVGGSAETVALAIVAAVGGYHGRTPRTPGEVSHRGVDGTGPREPGAVGPGTVAGQEEPAGTQLAAHTLGRFRWVLWVLGVCALGMTVAMGLAAHQFQRASSCAAPVPSRPCVASLPGVVSAPGRTRERSGYNGTSDTLYSIVVSLEGSGQRVEVWSYQPHPGFRVGDAAVVERWKGRFIAVADQGHRVEVDDWNPRVLRVMLWILYGSVVVAAVLWRLRLLGLGEHPRGLRAVSSSVFGWMFFVVACVLGSTVLGLALSAPQVYLCWW
ncbi:MAG TPA: hypothetical protein VFP72_00695 [Kineosporiaceae bacterium]|nr:hypothetical protein [Kineosporiaceae bacterium]